MAKSQFITPFPENIDRNAFGHYLSGFVDGEASFLLYQLGRPELGANYVQSHAQFRIQLRADDTDILRLIRSYWACGTLHSAHIEQAAWTKRKRTAVYTVSRIGDLIGTVVPHFERYPMWAKKRNDFPIWQQGVELIYTVINRRRVYRPGVRRHGGTYPKWTIEDREQFHSLATMLNSQRRYSEDYEPLPLPRKPSPDRQRMLFDEDHRS